MQQVADPHSSWQHLKCKLVVVVAMQCTTRMNGLIKQINEHVRRRTFLLGFSQSPASFINGLLASQVMHLKGLKHTDIHLSLAASFYAA